MASVAEQLVGKWKFVSYTHMFFNVNMVESSTILKAKPNVTIDIKAIGPQNDTDEVEGTVIEYVLTDNVPFTGVIGSGINSESISIIIEDDNLIVNELEEAQSHLLLFPEFPEDIENINNIVRNQFERFKSQGFTHILNFGDTFDPKFLITIKKANNTLITYKCNNNYFLIKEINDTKLVLLKPEGIAMARFDCSIHRQGQKSTSTSSSNIVHTKSSVLNLSR